MENGSKHFVLVHGGCHGAWCWYKVLTLLKRAGHLVTALDLGASGVNTKRLDEIHSIADYLQPLMEFLASLSPEEKVILVGHSYGGLPVSLAGENFSEKILVAVFVSAYMPHYKSPPGAIIQEFFSRMRVESLLDCQLTFNQGLENPPTSFFLGPEYLKSAVYSNCQLEDLELAKMLVRPTNLLFEELSKECLLTKEKWGSVDRVFVVCPEDQVMQEDFQRLMIDNYPPKQVRIIPSADHMVMLSKPQELSKIFQDIAQQYDNIDVIRD